MAASQAVVILFSGLIVSTVANAALLFSLGYKSSIATAVVVSPSSKIFMARALRSALSLAPCTHSLTSTSQSPGVALVPDEVAAEV